MTKTWFLAVCLLAAPAAAGEVVNLAGNGRDEFSGDGAAATTGVGQPFGLVIGPDEALYVCETSNHVIRRLDEAAGLVTVVAGRGRQKGYAGDGGPATEALLNEPYEVRFDDGGNLFFVEMRNNVVRRVDAETGRISTVAGNGRKGFSGDGGPAVDAELSSPHSIALDGRGGLYICDIGNQRVRRVDLESGAITTFAGTGAKRPTPDGAPIAGTPLNGPRALDVDAAGGLVLALREGNAVYRLDLQEGTLTHLAGTGKSGYAGDGGPAKDALLAGPKGVAIGPGGDIYLADTESHTIRVIRQKTGLIETLVGDGKRGDGPAGDPLGCRLDRPHGVFVDQSGDVYIGDSANNRVRKLIVRE